MKGKVASAGQAVMRIDVVNVQSQILKRSEISRALTAED